MAFNKIVDRAKATAKDASDKVRQTTEQAVEVGREKFREMSMALLAEVNGLKPILVECGFIIGDTNITLSIPPEFKMTVEQIGAGRRNLQEILCEDDATLTALQKAVLSSMIKAHELAEVTSRYGYTFCKYDVTMTVPPKVTIHLIANKSKG